MTLLHFSPKACLFDLDGTLVSSERNYQEAIYALLQSWNCPLSPEDKAFIIGRDLDEIYRYFNQVYVLPFSIQQFERELDIYYLTPEFRKKNKLIPGAYDFLSKIQSKIPCALVTNSRRMEAEQLLDFFDLSKYFSFLICAGEAGANKPHPEPYLMAATRLKVEKHECVAFEDSTVGITSAKEAGIFCIAIQAGNFSSQDQSKADLRVYSFTQAAELFID